MGFAAAAAPALTTAAPYIAAGTTTLGIIQAGKIGDYNEAVQNRKAAVLEQEAELIAKQTEFDLAQFDKQFRKLEGQTKVSIAKSGAVVGEGTGRRIEINNLREAEIEKNINYWVAKEEKLEAERKIKELIANYEVEMEKNITARWEADLKSDSWLSKNVRPMVLIFLIVCTMLLIFIDAGALKFEVKSSWVDLLQLVLITVIGAYFGGRSFEKVKK